MASYQNGSTPIYRKINSPAFSVTPGDYYQVTYTTISNTSYTTGLNSFAVGYTATNHAPVRPVVALRPTRLRPAR